MQAYLSAHPFLVTGTVFFAAAGSFAGLAIKDRRPRQTLDTPIIPTIPLMLITGMVAVVALEMLVSLLGLPQR